MNMKKWLIYVLGIITGIILTFAFAFYYDSSNNSGIVGLELFEEPGEYMDFSELNVFQVIDPGYALAKSRGPYGTIVFILPNENEYFYDDQEIDLRYDKCAQRVGTYKYNTKSGSEKTVAAIKIITGANPFVETASVDSLIKDNQGKILFDKPGDCVSRKNFEVQEVLESGDAIAKEIRETLSGYVITSDLEVLILADENSNFYNKQIVKAPQGKSARHIGNYKYRSRVIPIIDFR